MTTPRDLLITAMDQEAGRTLDRGDLSLALAGAELIDLLDAGAIALDGERIVPSEGRAVGDRVLDEAAASLVRQAPYETVDDWLWRRGRDLSAVYESALEADGQLAQERRRWMFFQPGRAVLVDTPARREASNRLAAEEPVLTTLAAAAGFADEPTGDSTGLFDSSVETVLGTVNDAVRNLEAERQRRSIEGAAFDNIWRGQ
jgi:hypothetical protein